MVTIMERSEIYKMNMQNRTKDLYGRKILSWNKHITWILDPVCDKRKVSFNFLDNQLDNINIFMIQVIS